MADRVAWSLILACVAALVGCADAECRPYVSACDGQRLMVCRPSGRGHFLHRDCSQLRTVTGDPAVCRPSRLTGRDNCLPATPAPDGP